jgi:hypothetical protein
MKKQYIVGIDLGTSNTVVAYHAPGRPQVELFAIDQLVGPGEVAARPLLPSVRYHPAAGEIKPGELQLPWQTAQNDEPVITGRLALDLGAQVPGRLVASAKSWLSHASVDRLAAILPWGAESDVARVSPVEASASYLAHVRAAWQHRFPQAPLEEQQVILTVPASFDEGARALTLAAARQAGLPRVRLLEEPQAGFLRLAVRPSPEARRRTRRNAAAAGLRHRWRHHRPDADPGRDHRRRAGPHTDRCGRPPDARRRQHGSRPRSPRRIPAAGERRTAVGGALFPAHRPLPAGQGAAAHRRRSRVDPPDAARQRLAADRWRAHRRTQARRSPRAPGRRLPAAGYRRRRAAAAAISDRRVRPALPRRSGDQPSHRRFPAAARGGRAARAGRRRRRAGDSDGRYGALQRRRFSRRGARRTPADDAR